MSELRAVALAILFGFVLFNVFATALYDASNDVNKTVLDNYDTNKSQLIEGVGSNMSVTDNEDAASNLNLIIGNMFQQLFIQQKQLSSNNPLDQITGAFGLIASLTIGMVQILAAILIDGLNFITGLGINIEKVPAPWNGVLFSIVTLGTIGFTVYVGIILFNAVTGRNA